MSFRKVERIPKPRLPGDPPERPRVVPESPSKPRKRLAPMSAKRKSEIAEDGARTAVRKAVLARAGYRCEAEALVPQVLCGFISDRRQLEVHEVIPRSVWPGGELVVANCKAVCPSHHSWIDDHPNLAHDVGLHGYSHERPKEDPDA